MVVSEVCGWMVTVNRDPQMQCLASLMQHMQLNLKYIYPLRRFARTTIMLSSCLRDLFPMLPKVCTMQKYTKLCFFFILKANSNTRDPNAASSVGLVLD